MGLWESKTVVPVTPIADSLFNYINNHLKKEWPGKIKAKWDKGNKLQSLEIEGLSQQQLDIIILECKIRFPKEFNEKDLR